MVEFYQNRVCDIDGSLIDELLFISFDRNPNEGSFSSQANLPEWKAYTRTEHNYMYFQLKRIRNEVNYFDSMYDFWLDIFRIEDAGACPKMKKKKKNRLTSVMMFLIVLSSIPMFYFIWKYFQKKKQREFLSSPPAASLPYPDHIST